MHTTAGPVELQVPRDRNGSFDPVIVPKRTRRLDVEDMIISLYARGMSTRGITAHLAEVYGAKVSAATISRVSDVVAEEITAWQNRPVDRVYPIVYIDAIAGQGGDAGAWSPTRPPTWSSGRPGAPQARAGHLDPADRGREVLVRRAHRAAQPRAAGRLFVCCDGLTGLPAAVDSGWPAAVVQTCVVHLIRASMRYVSWSDRKAMTATLRPIYTAVTVVAAELAFSAFREDWGRKAPGAVAAWERAWEEFAYPSDPHSLSTSTPTYTENLTGPRRPRGVLPGGPLHPHPRGTRDPTAVAQRGFTVPGNPGLRLHTLADVFAYAAAEGVHLRVDGAEVQARRPRANKPGRRTFVSGKKSRTPSSPPRSATAPVDCCGWCVSPGPDARRDRTAHRGHQGPPAAALRQVPYEVDFGYPGLARATAKANTHAPSIAHQLVGQRSCVRSRSVPAG